jgi:hypothetical protein
MAKNTKKLEKTGKKQDIPSIMRNEKGQVLPGQVSLNPNGRPLGRLNFSTRFFNVIDKLAKQNNLSPEEIEEQLIIVGYKKAKDGNFNFYSDLMDRVYGRAIQPTEVEVVGESLFEILRKGLRNDNNRRK